VIDLTRSCTRYRPVLIDFVDHGEVRAETGAALAHLDRCTRCTEVVESTMLTITALRRMGDDAATAEPPADAWPRLRIRIQGWRRRPATMSPLAGIAMSFAIVAVLVLPVNLGGSLLGPAATSITNGASGASATDRQIEAAYIASVRQRSLPPNAAATIAGSPGTYPRQYPDNYHPPRKEVSPAEPGGWPPRAI
jgi:anti-sigma factor RsiW